MALSAMGLKLGVFGVLSTIHEKQTQNKRVHAQTAVDAGDIRTWRTTVVLIPQFKPHAG